MEITIRRIALAILFAAALLCASSRNLSAENPPDGDSVTTSAVDDTERLNAADGQNLTPPLDVSPAGSSSLAPSSGALAPSGNAATAATQKGFWGRLAQAYYDDWHPSGIPQPPKYRGDPMPENSPPYPFNVWPIGGTVWIGYPNATNYPLTTALYGSEHWQWLKNANIQVYGWANAGMNFSTSNQAQGGKYANSPAAYNQIPNSIQLDQLTMYVERVPDTVQTDHFDWGFRFTGLYGMDYRFTTAQGYFSQQLLHTKLDGTLGNQYGVDPVMVYLDLYFPHVAQGMILRIGRYVSLPDIEAQLAPNNYTYTHSLTYTYDCYTQTGANATIKFSNFFTLQAGISPGCDTAPWKSSAELTGNLCGQFTFREGKDDIYLCANSLNSSKYAYNNLAAYYATWYHKINDKWHTDFESWYQYETKTPNIFNPAAASLLIVNANGAWCHTPSELTCYAPEWSILNYTNRQLKAHDFLSFRNEFFDDLRGQRTGIKGRYVEYGLSWNHWIGSTIVLRPEVRWEHNFDNLAYDGATRHSQFMFAADVIWFY